MTSEPVRSYLLGTLDEADAASIEERYFTDRGFSLFAQAVETALIEDYLTGRLAPPIKSRFEACYLSVPDLRRRIEEVGKMRVEGQIATGQIHHARFLLAAAILLFCMGGAALWFYVDHLGFAPLPNTTGIRPVLATLSLSPGLLKGEAAGVARLILQSGKGKVRLVLELPGRGIPILCSAQVSLASPNGGWNRVWSTPRPVWSTPSTGGQQVAILLDSSLLVHGDYLVEIVGAGAQTRETYSFRVSPM